MIAYPNENWIANVRKRVSKPVLYCVGFVFEIEPEREPVFVCEVIVGS
jgi:hypothetical protein